MDLATNVRITTVRFKNYKALADFQIRLSDTNFLVGPNNAGKSTIISAFRLLAVGLRRMSGRRPENVVGPKGRTFGITIPSDSLPVSIENVHTDYSDEDTTISFRLSNGNELQLFFPRDGACLLIADAKGIPLLSAASFRKAFPIVLTVIPVLAPVEHLEKLVLEDTVQKNISTHRASRNFRSYWYFNHEPFDEFAATVLKTWPGMRIERPTVVNHATNELMMFCEENRIPRELFWIGSGFQIWCQLLTHLIRARTATLVVIDEPEIYLHADLQRQLVGLLRTFQADVLVATHSTEIMGEADPQEMVLIDKRSKTAERLKNAERLQNALATVGSVHSISLSRLSRSRRIVFFEDNDDFKLIRQFAKRMGFDGLATGLEIFPAKSEGFGSWKRVASLGWGISKALDSAIAVGAVYDRDYFPDGQVAEIEQELNKSLAFSHVFARKEIENYLLLPGALQRAVNSAVRDKATRDETAITTIPNVLLIIEELTQQQRVHVYSQKIPSEADYLRKLRPTDHTSTIHSELIQRFESNWADLGTRLTLVPGKTILSELRERITVQCGVTLTNTKIINAAEISEIPEDMNILLEKLDRFRMQQIG